MNYNKPINTSDVAYRLKLLRRIRGVTQKAVCQKLHLTPSTYNSYELGRNLPNAANAGRIAGYFGVTLDWLYFGHMQFLTLDMVTKIESLSEHA